MSINYMGPDVREAQKDMELLPLPVLFQYMQNPQNMSADGVAFSLIAATELARRKRLEDAATASQQPDPSRVPTIAEGLMSGQMGDTGGVPTPKTGIAAFAQPAAPAPAPVAAAPAPAPAPAPVAMAGPPVRMAHGGIIAFSEGSEKPVPSADETFMQRTNREARERGVRESDPELAAIKDIDERNRRRLEKYGPPRDPILEGLASMGAAAKDVFSYPVRAIGAAANKYLPIPDIPESFFGGDRSSMTPYMDKLRKERMGEAEDTDSAILANRAKFAYGPSSGWSGVAPTSTAAATTAIAKPAPKPIARPAVAPTPTAPAVPAVPVASTEPDALAKAMEVLGAPPATLTPEQAEAARKQAQERLSGITDPRMARIAALQAEAEGIGSRRDEGALGRALMQLGLRTIQGGSRPGTAGSAVAGAGLEALSSYEKEQTGMIERALRTNQIKIELEKELMKQGVDRNTAADLAEREARKQVFDAEKEKRDSAKDLGTLALNKLTADQRVAYQTGLLEAKQRETEARAELQNATAGRRMDQILLATQKLEQAQRLVAIREIDAKRKLITDEMDAIAKSPLAFTQQGMQQIQRLMRELSALRAGGEGGAGGAQKEVSFADAIKSR